MPKTPPNLEEDNQTLSIMAYKILLRQKKDEPALQKSMLEVPSKTFLLKRC